MAKRTVVHALYSWIDEQGTPRMALRGQEIDLSGAQLERADRLGAVQEDGLVVDGPVVAPAPPVADGEAGKMLEEPTEKPASRRPAAAKP